MARYSTIFTEEKLESLFPATRADDFFEALFGDAEEGSYDIALRYIDDNDAFIDFELTLSQRAGQCLVCNLTYGLPQVFARHPIINVQGIANAVAEAVGKSTATWKLSATKEISNKLHTIPLRITLD